MKTIYSANSAKKIAPKIANILGIITIISWGSLGLLGSQAASLPPFFVLAVCFWGASAIGLSVIALSANRIKTGSINFVDCAVGGVFLFGYHYLYFLAFHYAPAAEVSLLNYLWPAFVIIIGNLFFSLRSGWRGMLAAAIGFAGIAVLFGANLQVLTQQDNQFGFALALIGAIVWATYSNLRRNSRGEVLPTVTIICAIAATLSTGFSWASESQQLPSSEQLITLMLLTLGPAGGAFFLWDLALKKGNAALLAVLGYGAPLISTALLVVAGLAEPSLRLVMATLLIAVGGLVTIKRTKSSKLANSRG